MRMLLHVIVDTPAGTRALQDGSMAASVGNLVEALKPEATYFFGHHGKRSAIFVFDMQDSSQIPAIVEPAFRDVNAEVYLTPAMNMEDLQKGLAAFAGA